MFLSCGRLLSITSGYQSKMDLMEKLTNQQRLEQIETDLERMQDHFAEKMEALEERISKKQEGTDGILAKLLEGQMRLLEKEGIRSYGHVEHQEFSHDQKG